MPTDWPRTLLIVTPRAWVAATRTWTPRRRADLRLRPGPDLMGRTPPASSLPVRRLPRGQMLLGLAPGQTLRLFRNRVVLPGFQRQRHPLHEVDPSRGKLPARPQRRGDLRGR